MQLIVTINKKDYELPGGWQDITLRQFLVYQNDIAPNMPNCLEEAMLKQQKGEYRQRLGDILTRAEKAESLMYFAAVVAHFTSIELPILTGEGDLTYYIEPHNVIRLYEHIERILSRPTYTGEEEETKEGRYKFKLRGQTFFLPKRHMTESTVLEFIEAAQYQKVVEDLKNGVWESLPKVMAILCRRKDEPYHSKLVEQRAAWFLDCNMQDCLNTVFFLMKQSVAYFKSSRTSSVPMNLAIAIAKLKRKRTQAVPLMKTKNS